MTKSWQGDWYSRIYLIAAKHDFATVRDFVAAFPRRTWLELAKEFGQGEIAAVQLQALAYDEALKRNDVIHFAKDCLVREFHHYLPEGWGKGDNFLFELSGVYAWWKNSMDDSYAEHAERAWKWLKAQNIPEGWLPEGPDDPWIEAMFRETGFPGASEPAKPH